MLRELRIRGFAVIDEVRLELGPGLTVLTGETGAGKSIIVGALSLLLGERASADLVRAGSETATVEAAFDLEGRDEVLARCEEAGLQSDGWLVLRRELQREGRNRAWANDSPATATLVGELGSALVDLHGQHEHQALLRRAAQRRILDAYAGAADVAAEVARLHDALAEARRRVEEVRRRAEDTRERADYLRFKAGEIEDAGLEAGEDERLEAEARRLEHSEELLTLSSSLYEAVYAEEGAVIDRLGALRRPLGELRRIDPDTEELAELHEGALRAAEELGRRLGAYRDGVEHDPSRLRVLRTRLDELFRLKKKYGGQLADVIAAGREARAELDALDSSDREIRRLEAEAAEARETLAGAAEELGRLRREAAGRLEGELGSLLPELGMPGARFEVSFQPLEEPGRHGAERVEFLVSLNPGFEPGPLSRIASGGETSRVMLALKTALTDVDDVPSLVFDEIDAGVGGEVAHRVAERLDRLARTHQVFAVTHLAQIAARAEAHFHVEKGTVDGRAAATARCLEADDRIRELARMLGGDPESAVSRSHAEELLAAAPKA